MDGLVAGADDDGDGVGEAREVDEAGDDGAEFGVALEGVVFTTGRGGAQGRGEEDAARAGCQLIRGVEV